MSLTAEQRAQAIVELLKSDFGQSGDDVWFFAIRDELNAHAAAARLEERERIATAVKSGTIHGVFIRDEGHALLEEIATAIRALHDEKAP